MAIKFHGGKEVFIDMLNSHFNLSNTGEQVGNCFRYKIEYDSNTYNINLFENGTVNIQPTSPDDLYKKIKDALSESRNITQYRQNKNQIFVVHGHDIEAKNALELILYRWNLQPYAIQDADSRGSTIIEFLETQIKQHSVGIVLLTKDDMGYSLKDGENFKRSRARQNVILELGMLIGAMGRKNCIIITQVDIERPSDIDGLIYLPFNKEIDEIKEKLREKLENILSTKLPL